MKKLTIVVLALVVALSATTVFAQTNPAVTTTLAAAVTTTTQSQIRLTSTTGITAGMGLYIDGEFMTVLSVTSPNVFVTRAAPGGGTFAQLHANSATVIAGPLGMFGTTDPLGVCPVAPFQYLSTVNTVSGNVWLCRYVSGGSRQWVGTNNRQLTYNSITVK